RPVQRAPREVPGRQTPPATYAAAPGRLRSAEVYKGGPSRQPRARRSAANQPPATRTHSGRGLRPEASQEAREPRRQPHRTAAQVFWTVDSRQIRTDRVGCGSIGGFEFGRREPLPAIDFEINTSTFARTLFKPRT